MGELIGIHGRQPVRQPHYDQYDSAVALPAPHVEPSREVALHESRQVVEGYDDEPEVVQSRTVQIDPQPVKSAPSFVNRAARPGTPLSRAERRKVLGEAHEAYKEEKSLAQRSAIYMGKLAAVWLAAGVAFTGVTTAEHAAGFTANTTYTITSDPGHDIKAIATGAAGGPIEFNNKIVKPIAGIGSTGLHGVMNVTSFVGKIL